MNKSSYRIAITLIAVLAYSALQNPRSPLMCPPKQRAFWIKSSNF